MCKITDGWSQISADIRISRIIAETKNTAKSRLISNIIKVLKQQKTKTVSKTRKDAKAQCKIRISEFLARFWQKKIPWRIRISARLVGLRAVSIL